ncbi:MAG: indole-3-glycerol phosphate synthase TrpC [Planctomycetota bacterium]
MSGFLDSAFAEAHRRVESWRRNDLLGALRDAPVPRSPGGGLAAALRGSNPMALIAEIKRASPSQGMLNPDVDVAGRARLYVDGGAAAVSILTEPRWFAGSIDDFVTARRATRAPLLRKDFIVDEYDLEVSAAIGADAVLLIAARFDADRLQELLAFANGLGLEALVETHGADDAATACEAGAFIIGVNSRNLQTLQVDVEGALGALRLIPPDRLRVLESGINSQRDVQAAVEAGADAVLVGEVLMRSSDPAETIRLLLEGAEPRKPECNTGNNPD